MKPWCSKGKRTRGSRTRIRYLPEDILANIFLRVEDRHVLALVCRKWHELERIVTQDFCFEPDCEGESAPKCALLPLVSRYFNLTHLEISYKNALSTGEEQVGDDCLLALPSACVNLTDLFLNCCKRITDVGIANITLCPRLTGVGLLGLPCISDKGLLALARGRRSLTHLRLGSLCKVTGAEWLEVIGMDCQIERFVIEYCGIEESQLVKLGRRGWRKLRDFRYFATWIDNESQVQSWRLGDAEETECCPNLEYLTVSGGCLGSRPGLFWLLGQCTALQELEVEGAQGLQDEDIHLLAKNNPQLSVLRLSSPMNLTNVSLIRIADRFHWLKTLRLSFWTGELVSRILESGIVAIAESCTRLETLDFRSIPCLGNAAMTAIGNLPSLREVHFEYCENLTDESVILMGSGLTKMVLIRCPLLTDECLSRYRTSHGALADLLILGCPGITQEAAEGATVGEVRYYP